jgi:hypothetical protein
MGRLGESEIGPALEKALRLCWLKNMDQKSESGYAFGFVGDKPDTWGLQDKIAPEITALTAKLSKHGITQVRVGQELEFGLDGEAIDGFTHWQDVKSSIISGLEKEITKANGAEQDRLNAKLAEVKEFSAREVLMYDMIELDNRTKDLLEPLFGRTRDGDGYYDAKGCLELKLNHCPIEEYSNRHQTVLSVLIEKAKAYGLPLNSPPSSHLSFSFWDDQGNITHPSHADYTTKGKVITEGITRGLYDALPMIMDPQSMGTEENVDTNN